MVFGKKKPEQKVLKWYSPHEPELSLENKGWVLQWTNEKIKNYYLEGLILHELGHLMDSFNKRF